MEKHIIEKVRRLVARVQLREAIDLLFEHLPNDSPLRIELDSLLRRLNDIEKRLINEITRDSIIREKREILGNITALIHKYDPEEPW